MAADKRTMRACQVCGEVVPMTARQKYCQPPKPCAEEGLRRKAQALKEKRAAGRLRCPTCNQLLPRRR
jgi:hypothetical protein